MSRFGSMVAQALSARRPSVQPQEVAPDEAPTSASSTQRRRSSVSDAALLQRRRSSVSSQRDAADLEGEDGDAALEARLHALEQEVREAADALQLLLQDAGERNGGSALQEIFNKYDTDGSGSIELEEWREAMKDLGVAANDDVIEALFKRYDADGGGSIEYEEFIRYAQPSSQGEEAGTSERSRAEEVERITHNLKSVLQQKRGTAALKKLFEKYDSDGSGSLDVEEFAKTLRDLGVGKGARTEDLRAVFSRFDSDGSGSLEFMEFVNAVASTPAENRQTDQKKLQAAKLKHQQIEAHKAMRSKQEQDLRQRISEAEKKLEEARAKAHNPNFPPSARMEYLAEAQKWAEAMQAAQEEERQKLEEWNKFDVKLDEEDRRLLRGVLALQSVQRKLQASNTLKKVVALGKPAASGTSSGPEAAKAPPSQAEVKAKMRRAEIELKAVAEEEEDLKAQRRIKQQQLDQCQKEANELPPMALMQKLQLMEKAAVLAQEVEDLAAKFVFKQDEWRLRREQCRFTPEEERIMRGIKALQKTRQEREQRTAAPSQEAVPLTAVAEKGGTALELLKRKSKLLGRMQSFTAAAEEERKAQARVRELEEAVDLAVLRLDTTHGDENSKALASLDATKQQLDQARAELEALKTRGAAQPQRRKSVGFADESASVGVAEIEAAAQAFNSLLEDIRSKGDESCIKALFDKYDADGSGKLDMPEFVAGMKDLGVSQNEDVLEALFNRYDQDGSGSIDYDEFRNLQPAELVRQDEVERLQAGLREVVRQKKGVLALRKLFERYDADKSGSLDVEEFAATLQDLGLGKGSTMADFRAVFKKFDADGSGSIEFMEFIEGVKNSSVDQRKAEAELQKRAKEKQKLIAEQKELREKQEREVTEKRTKKEQEVNDLKEKIAQTPSLMEKLPLMEQAMQLQEELEQLIFEERDTLERWKTTVMIELTREEERVLRGLRALQTMRQKVEVVAQFTKAAATAPADGAQPTAAQVKAKVAQKEKLEKEFADAEAAIKRQRKERETELEAIQSATHNPSIPLEEKFSMLERAQELAQLLQDTAGDLANCRDSYRQKLEPLQLTKDDERVLRGIKAMEAMKGNRRTTAAVIAPEPPGDGTPRSGPNRGTRNSRVRLKSIVEGSLRLRELEAQMQELVEQIEAAPDDTGLREAKDALQREIDAEKEAEDRRNSLMVPTIANGQRSSVDMGFQFGSKDGTGSPRKQGKHPKSSKMDYSQVLPVVSTTRRVAVPTPFAVVHTSQQQRLGNRNLQPTTESAAPAVRAPPPRNLVKQKQLHKAPVPPAAAPSARVRVPRKVLGTLAEPWEQFEKSSQAFLKAFGP
eukprot:TRINITY_DN8007_c0_g1_i1.p1 TRINITY_DN8007_c0_g1~~TRINITY_DN8007_c0_g1_i1.p1  ORF type:complete len:1333 (-),score=361.12 TRINITY_DN8007_c0_g1_i1:6-4004(-)